jgi:hypothetical protein
MKPKDWKVEKKITIKSDKEFEKEIEIYEENFTRNVEYKKLIIPLNHHEGASASLKLTMAFNDCLDMKAFDTDFAKNIIQHKWN